MSTATVEVLPPLQRALDVMSGALDEVGDPALSSLTDREVDALLVGLKTVVSRVRARSLAVLAEARGRNRAAALGATSVNAHVAQTLPVGPVEAARLVARSRVLEAASADPVTASIGGDARSGAAPVEQRWRRCRRSRRCRSSWTRTAVPRRSR